MSRLGLKYLSSSGESYSAVNPGKWNLASNFRKDMGKILTDSGIAEEDFISVGLYIRYIRDGLFICAARREDAPQWIDNSYEALWMFVPASMKIEPEELARITDELVRIYDHPEAFESPEAFEDALPGMFSNEFEDTEETPEGDLMKGSRVGFLSYETFEELQLILSCGYRPQYENFSLIFLTDNPVKVEASLPRIFLPELTLNRELKSTKEEPQNEKLLEEETFTEEREVEVDNEADEAEEGKEEITEEGRAEESEENKEENPEENTGSSEEEKAEDSEEDKKDSEELSQDFNDVKASTLSAHKFSWLSFLLGILFSTILIILYFIIFK